MYRYQRNDAPPLAGQVDIPKGKPYCLANRKFVITGQLPSLTRDECKDLISEYGGRVTGGVSGATNYLIVGDEPGESKLKKAKEKRVEIIDEAKLLDMIRTNPAGKAPKIKKMKMPPKSKILPRKPSNINNNNNNGRSMELFVEKYKPTTSRDLIGNQANITRLRTFLQTWYVYVANIETEYILF